MRILKLARNGNGVMSVLLSFVFHLACQDQDQDRGLIVSFVFVVLFILYHSVYNFV